MSANFNELTTTEDVLSGVDLAGRRVLVTGVSSGLGVETARALVAHGADVVGAARDIAKAEAATGEVRGAAEQGGSFELVELDLASLASVRACADRLIADGRPFDLVIGNAGVMATPFGHTADGFETQFGTNHLGHFVFINRIAPLIRDGGRLVMLSSSGHRGGDVDIEDPNYETGKYNQWGAYARSKTANVLFAVEFDRRHRARGIRACAVHPGRIGTGLFRHLGEDGLANIEKTMDKSMAEKGLPPSLTKSVAQGAATSVWAGVVAPADAVGGQFCEDCHVAEVNDSNQRTGGANGVKSYALDPERAKALWARSEQLVRERFPE